MKTDEEWYAERDHRSNLVRAWDATPTPTLVVEPSLARTREGEISAEVLVNIVARFMRKATLVLPNRPSLLHAGKTMHDALKEVATFADPRFELHTVDTMDERVRGEAWLILGDDGNDALERFVPVLGGVQLLPAGAKGPESSASDAMGAILAGCFAARSVFARASGMEDLLPTKPFTFVAMRARPTRLDLGRVHLVGAGGVGSNIAYYLPLIGCTAHVTVIDHDHVTASNLNRCLPFWDAHARSEAKKADVVASHLKRVGIDAEPHVMTYGEFVKNKGRGSPDIVLMLANELEVWNTVQNNFPPLTFSSATSANWGIHTARHEPITDACVACLLGMHDHTNAPLACDTAEMPQTEKKELGVLPFFAPLAAALLLAHVLDTLNGGNSLTNFRMMNVGVPYPRVEETRLPKRRNCICSVQDPDVHRIIIERTSRR